MKYLFFYWSRSSLCCRWWKPKQAKLKQLVDHRYFQRGILTAILVNTLSMGIEYHNQVYYGRYFHIFKLYVFKKNYVSRDYVSCFHKIIGITVFIKMKNYCFEIQRWYSLTQLKHTGCLSLSQTRIFVDNFKVSGDI